MFDYAVYIGRFQIPHYAHIDTIRQGLKEAYCLIIAIGSTNVRRNLRNPFSYEQRMAMIENSAPDIKEAVQDGFIKFVPLEDSVYSDQWWVEHVQRQVKGVISPRSPAGSKDPSVGLLGCNRDETTYYLDMFPQWQTIQVQQTRQYSATDCRNMYYEYGPFNKLATNFLHQYTTPQVIEYLQSIPTQVYNDLKERFDFVKGYREQWGVGPFYTADPVVIRSGHILLIQRGAQPDIGAWAFPGGFINEGEDPVAAAVRELQEETGLTLSPTWYEFVTSKEYKRPFRDDRADIITTASLFNLGNGPLPKVEGMDDAANAEWVPIADLTGQNMFADHYMIFRDLIREL